MFIVLVCLLVQGTLDLIFLFLVWVQPCLILLYLVLLIILVLAILIPFFLAMLVLYGPPSPDPS